MRDRLQDLQNNESNKDTINDDKGKGGKSVAPTATIGDFFNELAEVKESIATIKKNIEEIQGLHGRALNNVASEKQSAELSRELDAVMDRTNSESTKVREMDQTNKQLQRSDPKNNDTNIRVTQHGVVTKQFMEVMNEYKTVQESYQAKFKERMQRQALIVKPNATEAEMEQMMEGKTQMFTSQIVNTAQRVEAKKALDDIQKKHLEVLKIEKSILELQQLFMDMAVLLASQGEMVDQIAVHVNSAVADTEKGVEALNKAVKLQKKSRKNSSFWSLRERMNLIPIIYTARKWSICIQPGHDCPGNVVPPANRGRGGGVQGRGRGRGQSTPARQARVSFRPASQIRQHIHKYDFNLDEIIDENPNPSVFLHNSF